MKKIQDHSLQDFGIGIHPFVRDGKNIITVCLKKTNR
jgi:hypothetical protein